MFLTDEFKSKINVKNFGLKYFMSNYQRNNNSKAAAHSGGVLQNVGDCESRPKRFEPKQNV